MLNNRRYLNVADAVAAVDVRVQFAIALRAKKRKDMTIVYENAAERCETKENARNSKTDGLFEWNGKGMRISCRD